VTVCDVCADPNSTPVFKEEAIFHVVVTPIFPSIGNMQVVEWDICATCYNSWRKPTPRARKEV